MVLKLILKKEIVTVAAVVLMIIAALLAFIFMASNIKEKAMLQRGIRANELQDKAAVLEETLYRFYDEMGYLRGKPAPEKQEPVLFKQKLLDSLKAISSKAKRHNLALPDSLGFDENKKALPGSSDICDLSARLDVVTELINDMTLAGVNALERISYSPYSASNDNRYGTIKVDMDIKCKTEALVNFLRRLNASKYLFEAVVNKIESDRGVLDVTLSLSAATLLDNKDGR